jgi:hypothetical protein
MNRAALMLLFVALLTDGAAAGPVAEDDTIDLAAQEFIAEMRARANEQTTVFVHLDETPSRSVDSMVNSVIGALVMPCNPLWAEGCEIPIEPLVRILRDAGAPLPAGGLPCDRAPVQTLEACLPGFDVLPSPNGEQLYLTTQVPAHADDFERTAAKRAEILASTNYTRLGTCHVLVRVLYEWGVVDQIATGIALGLTDSMTRMVKQAEAIGNHELRRGSAGFLIGFCTATMHIHMANRDGAERVPTGSAQIDASSPVFQGRTARLQNQDTFNPDYCRGHIGKLRDANAIDEVADVMLRSALDKAIERGAAGTSDTPRQDIAQGFGYGLCSAVLNAVMGAVK